MSVVDKQKIDAVALTDDESGIVLLISDHLDWQDEYNHLLVLQEKINTYVTFLEEGQYKSIYEDNVITYGIIEIHFLCDITKKAEEFLQSVQDSVANLGIRIRCIISSEDVNEA